MLHGAKVTKTLADKWVSYGILEALKSTSFRVSLRLSESAEESGLVKRMDEGKGSDTPSDVRRRGSEM